MINHYTTLGVPRDSTASDIKKAYRKLAMKYHPDKNPGNKEAEARMKEITAAYDAIGDDEKRAAYDRELLLDAGYHSSSTPSPPSDDDWYEERHAPPPRYGDDWCPPASPRGSVPQPRYKPKCHHGINCRKFGCPYRHPYGRTRECHYGINCRKFGCTFLHPKERKPDCRFFLNKGGCTRPGCHFRHPVHN